MSKVVINSHKEFEAYIGEELGVSDYLKIEQERVNAFAEATIDHQWIHIDEEKAKSEGAFGGTIAHGYLTVSLLPYLWEQIAEINNIKMMINYGIENTSISCHQLMLFTKSSLQTLNDRVQYLTN